MIGLQIAINYCTLVLIRIDLHSLIDCYMFMRIRIVIRNILITPTGIPYLTVKTPGSNKRLVANERQGRGKNIRNKRWGSDLMLGTPGCGYSKSPRGLHEPLVAK